LKTHQQQIQLLLKKNKFPEPVAIVDLPSSGSNRKYFRVTFNTHKSLLAAFNQDVNENIAWFSFSMHFRQKQLHIPEIFAKDPSYKYFLLEDLGDTSLFRLVSQGIDEKVINLYKKSISELIRFQVEGIKGLDLDVAWPVKEFNRKSIMWDLNYFKYYFIKTHEIEFAEDMLEDDFQNFANDLLEADSGYFLYRDFQARNIIIKQDKPWFIDFQGGRKGPLQYDLVSLLYQAKANLSDSLKKELYNFYLRKLEKTLPGKAADFTDHFTLFVYFRLMQVLGAYGFRGLIQRKGHFLTSIPFAIENLKKLESEVSAGIKYPELKKVFNQILALNQYEKPTDASEKLTVVINSFSYKKTSYPIDQSENGGGFVFDCRFLPNPGRIADLRDFNGTEKPVIEYLRDNKKVSDFLENAFKMVENAIDNYLERKFTSLHINFGCTGGKHRSVYSAERLSEHLQKYDSKVTIVKNHLQKNDW